MSKVAKLFTNGRSQAVRLPAAYRFDTKEVFIHQDSETGDVILSRKPLTWDDFFSALKGADAPADFLAKKERSQGTQDRGERVGLWLLCYFHQPASLVARKLSIG